MQNSLTLSKDEVLTRISRGDKYVIRIKTPRNKEIKINDSTLWTESASYDYHMSIIITKVGFSWYLSDFLSHNWFTGAELSLEPSISYNWTIRNEHFNNLIRKYNGIRFNLALISYF